MRNQQFNLAMGLDQSGGNYGLELNTNANAASITNEANATTGFTGVFLTGTGANVFESQGTVKAAGSYALHSDANDTPTAHARFYTDLNAAPYSLTAGKTYVISVSARHIGTGGTWNIRLSNASDFNTNVTNIASITVAAVTFTTYTLTFVHSANTRYFGAKETNGTDNGGIYFDSFSIKQVNQ